MENENNKTHSISKTNIYRLVLSPISTVATYKPLTYLHFNALLINDI